MLKQCDQKHVASLSNTYKKETKERVFVVGVKFRVKEFGCFKFAQCRALKKI